MTTSRTGSLRGARALLAALALAGGLAATGASAAPAFAPLGSASQGAVTPVQYWGNHGGWGHRRHHDGPRYGGYGHRHEGWGHRRHHGGGYGRGWGHRHHHHHRGHDRYDY